MADPGQTGPNPIDTYWSLTRRRRADARRQHFRDRTNRTPKRPMSQSEAIEQAKAMPGLNAYVCRYCGSWHVGHGHKGRAGRPDAAVPILRPCCQMLDVKGDGRLDLDAPLCGKPAVQSILTQGGTVDLCAEHAPWKDPS